LGLTSTRITKSESLWLVARPPRFQIAARMVHRSLSAPAGLLITRGGGPITRFLRSCGPDGGPSWLRGFGRAVGSCLPARSVDFLGGASAPRFHPFPGNRVGATSSALSTGWCSSGLWRPVGPQRFCACSFHAAWHDFHPWPINMQTRCSLRSYQRLPLCPCMSQTRARAFSAKTIPDSIPRLCVPRA